MLLLMEFKLVPICPQLQAIQSLCTSLISIQQMSKSGICTVIWSLYCHPHFTDEEKSKDVNFFSKVAAAAKSLQSCPTLCYPIDGSPPGSPVPGILQARTLEWVAISFSISKVKTKQISDPNTILCSNWKNLLIWKDVDDKCDNSQIIHNKQ